MLLIGRAANPALPLLDEATEGLAPLAAQEIWRVIAMLLDEP
jgi:branched-chain amino acid transport system ATP-binding protein